VRVERWTDLTVGGSRGVTGAEKIVERRRFIHPPLETVTAESQYSV
jgi:hypothetical protein